MKNVFVLQTRTWKVPLLFILTFVFTTPSLFAQQLDRETLEAIHDETPDDAYIAVDRSAQGRSPSYNVNDATFFTRQVNIDGSGNNIMNDAANEPSLAVDPTNPNRVVIGWRQFDDIGNNFRQAGYGFSTDGGESWTFPGVLNPGLFRSDPVLDFDADGNFYYNSLQNDFSCDVFQINDGGVVWGPPAQAKGGDKQWMRIDRSGGTGDGHNYSYWNSSFTTCAPGNFTRSTDGSNTFEDCVVVDGEPFWGTLAVDKNGVMYITGTTGADIVVLTSTSAQNAGTTVDFAASNPVDLDGFLNAGNPINPQGLLGQAWVDVDISNGPGEGNVYVAAAVGRFTGGDAGDVMFARSTDGGVTFEPPVKINSDASTDNIQWFGTMAVAPNGRIDIVWLDTRDNPGTFMSRLYYSFSEDQGTTWSDNMAISDAFDPSLGYPQQNKMGDYFDIKSDNDFAHVAWCGTFTGGQDVYYTRISPDGTLGLNDIPLSSFNVNTYPNPFSEELTISFNGGLNGATLVEVVDLNGRMINQLYNGDGEANQTLNWNGTTSEGAQVQDGLYFIRITHQGNQAVEKILLQRK